MSTQELIVLATLTPAVIEVLRQIEMVEVLSEEQAAIFLRPAKPMAVATLKDWRVRGLRDGRPGPPFVKVGGGVGYQKEPLRNWIKAQERDTTSDKRDGNS